MAERPILFSGPMVRELFAGRKTQTRRPVKVRGMEDGPGWPGRPTAHPSDDRQGQPCWCDGLGPAVFCPYGSPGDRLWVRETFSRERLSVYPCPRAWYRADLADHEHAHHPEDGYCRVGELGCLHGIRWTPAIHMPRRLSRLTLEVTAVRVERLDDLTEEDARAEGMASAREPGDVDLRHTFRRLWAAMYGAGSQHQGVLNPWVWVVSFQRVEASGG